MAAGGAGGRGAEIFPPSLKFQRPSTRAGAWVRGRAMPERRPEREMGADLLRARPRSPNMAGQLRPSGPVPRGGGLGAAAGRALFGV